MPPPRFCRSIKSGSGSCNSSPPTSKPMPEEAARPEIQRPQEGVGKPSQYHAMVLLVDDQAMVCEAVRRALGNQVDIDFHYCSDARDALAIANQIRPTVILQDLVM